MTIQGAAQRVYDVLAQLDKDLGQGTAANPQGSVQTAMAILLNLMPDDCEHWIVCEAGTCPIHDRPVREMEPSSGDDL